VLCVGFVCIAVFAQQPMLLGMFDRAIEACFVSLDVFADQMAEGGILIMRYQQR
jgi:hypothetical protein